MSTANSSAAIQLSMALLLHSLPTPTPERTQPPRENPRRTGGSGGRNLSNLCCRAPLTECQSTGGRRRTFRLGRPLPRLFSDQPSAVSWAAGATGLCPFRERLFFSGCSGIQAAVQREAAAGCASFLKQLRPGCSQVEKCRLRQAS